MKGINIYREHIYIYSFLIYRFINEMLDDFLKIYDLQDTGTSFTNVTALLSALNKDFPKLLQTPIKDYFLSMGFEQRFIDEIVQATVVTNYGQDVNIQSFVGLVSVAGVSDNLWSVKNGNKEVIY